MTRPSTACIRRRLPISQGPRRSRQTDRSGFRVEEDRRTARWPERAPSPLRNTTENRLKWPRNNGLKVVNGKIRLPDLRIEYETAGGESARVDLELATEHYRGDHMSAKERAGFKIYADSRPFLRAAPMDAAPSLMIMRWKSSPSKS